MKRLVSVILALVFAATLFTACGESATPDGKYVIKTIDGKTMEEVFKAELGDEAQGLDIAAIMQALGLGSLEDYFSIEFKSDGTATVKSAGEDEDAGTWKMDGSKVIVTIDGEPGEFELDGNQLKADIDGQKYVFEKK